MVDEALASAAHTKQSLPLSRQHLPNSTCFLRRLLVVQIPEDLENVPMVDEALASAAYTSATSLTHPDTLSSGCYACYADPGGPGERANG
jgi:hypothetical protein